jgi:hypothetical protein
VKACAGDWLEVLSKEDILRTLDKDGPSCRKCSNTAASVFVFTSARTRPAIPSAGIMRGCAEDGFHLNLRCDGQAYGGCQAGCLIFWKSACLKPVDGPAQVQYVPKRVQTLREEAPSRSRCTESDVLGATKRQGFGGEAIYSCQATELLNYTAPLSPWDARQYVDSYRSGNRTLLEIGRGFLYLFYYYGTLAFSDRWGRPARWLYNRIQAITGGSVPQIEGNDPGRSAHAQTRSRSSAGRLGAGEIL